MKKIILGQIAITVFVFDGAAARAACRIADPNDTTLNVRDAPSGKIVNRLKNGREVHIELISTDERGRRWAWVSGVYRGAWRKWGWVVLKYLNCPFIIPSQPVAQEILRERDLKHAGIGWLDFDQKLPVHCPPQGEGYTISLSSALYNYYRGRGFSKRALCLSLASEDVRFNPATGKPLKLYKRKGLDQTFPLNVPDCFRRAQIIKLYGLYEVVWRPAGCTVRYHPSSGVPVTDKRSVVLLTGGAAGEVPDESASSGSSTIGADSLRDLLRGN